MNTILTYAFLDITAGLATMAILILLLKRTPRRK